MSGAEERARAMPTCPAAFSDEFVRVELRSRSPRLWGWSVCRGNGTSRESSDAAFRCAEDAWKAGQAALGQHVQPRGVDHPATRSDYTRRTGRRLATA